MIHAYLWLHIAAAGLWPLLWKFGLTGLLIAGLLAAYIFMPVGVATMFPNLRKFLPWAAGVLAVSLVSYAVGVADEHNRAVEQNRLAVQQAIDVGTQARDEAVDQVRKQMDKEAHDILTDKGVATVGGKVSSA